MKFYLFVLIFITSLNLNAQIEVVKTDEGSKHNEVTDIIVVFKMHFDIGYTNWAEGILQEYRSQMLEETLTSIEETS
ncbi:MAG: hypothetical protein QNK20_08500, partial [Aureibaculum sp.]|nr:hypothetical protein [Aureibaculum sp.]